MGYTLAQGVATREHAGEMLSARSTAMKVGPTNGRGGDKEATPEDACKGYDHVERD